MTKTKRAAAVALFVFCATAFARDAVIARHFIVAAANPLAVEAGDQILARGGSALDAAIAVQLVLGLVEPQSSGLGGGAFLLHWSQSAKKLRSYDGRETAPAAAQPDRFLGADGRPLGFYEAAVGGRSVGVPGVMRMLELAHRAHGRLPWRELFQPAIALATQGFPMSPRLHALLQADRYLRANDGARRLYYGRQVGERVVNLQYAATLKALAEHGADAFYEGPIAEDIVRAVHRDWNEKDLAKYHAIEREPVCGPYRQWRVCSMGPPSSGGVALLQILGLLERTSFAQAPPASAPAVHLFAEAGLLAYADRARYVADPDVVAVPVGRLLSAPYLDALAKRIGQRAMREAPARDLEHGTSHFCIVEDNGDAVAMTTSIESAFGSRILVRGFLLNNELTDFDFVPGGANQVGPGKRPRSSMAPTMVFEPQGGLVVALGSAGGSAIINHVAKALVGVLDWRFDIQRAIDLPNFGRRYGGLELERGSALEKLVPALTARGHETRVLPLQSGLHGVERVPGGWRGGADSRREGIAKGE